MCNNFLSHHENQLYDKTILVFLQRKENGEIKLRKYFKQKVKKKKIQFFESIFTRRMHVLNYYSEHTHNKIMFKNT